MLREHEMKTIRMLIKLWVGFRREYKARRAAGAENEARDFIKECPQQFLKEVCK
jgi:hypothetical protein